MEEPLPGISIIVPAHNAERTIGRCLDSLLSQGLNDYEIIVVDDCSDDHTAEIIKAYQSANNHIVYCKTKKNSGSGVARNLGLTRARKYYIGFADSDDWMDALAYSVMIAAAQEARADIAICGIVTEYGNAFSTEPRYKYSSLRILEGRQALRAFTRSIQWDIFISPIVNNKIYRSDYLKQHDILFNAERFAQDNFFTFFSFAYANKAIVVPEVHYHYFQREESLSNTFTREYLRGMVETLSDIEQELKRRNLFSKYQYEFDSLLHRCFSVTSSRMFNNLGKNNRTKELACFFIEESVRRFGLTYLLDSIDVSRLKKMLIS